MTRLRGRIRRDERGFTLIELTVTAAVLVIATFGLFSFLDGTTNVTSRVGKNVTREEDLQIALRTITSDLRSSENVTACSSIDYRTCVTVDIPRAEGSASCPAKTLSYWLASSTIYESRVDYSSACASTTVWTNRTLLTGVTSTGTIFTYYDENGTAINPLTNASSIPSAASIAVSLAISQGNANAPNLTLRGVAALRNNR